MATRSWWVLRLGAACCFIGHGAFGFLAKAAWVPYFGVVGIPEPWARQLMPLIGAVDVLAGMAVLFGPTRLPLVYMVVWATWTALLRPLSGESVFEALERAGNYGVPLALLVLVGWPRSWRGLVSDLGTGGWWALNGGREPPTTTYQSSVTILRWTTVLLLIGHGALGLLGKPLLAGHYATLGAPPGTPAAVGGFEIVLAALVAVRPAAGLLGFVAAWKLATESLFLVAGAPIWEFVERAGSYAAPLALALLTARAAAPSAWAAPRTAPER